MRLPGRGLLVLAGFLLGGHARAQTPAPPAVTLLAPANTEVASVRLTKLTSQELGRRGQKMVSDLDGSAYLGRPLSAALADCSGDELCYVALGQVVNATQVLVLSAAFATKDTTHYDCRFEVIDVKSGKTRGQMFVNVLASEAGLSIAANTIAENIAPRPRLTTVATPTPAIAAPTPAPVVTASPAPYPLATAVAAAPTPTPGVAGLDQPPPRPRGPRPPLTKDPAFWSVAGAGALALGIGLFFGARSLENEGGDEKEGQSTVEVRF